jgi:hypothetical protein
MKKSFDNIKTTISILRKMELKRFHISFEEKMINNFGTKISFEVILDPLLIYFNKLIKSTKEDV